MRRVLTTLTLAITLAAPVQALDLQGHRGARGLAPENTIPAFARALEIGVTTLELDVGVTEDGVVVVHHDRRLNPDVARGPDGRWVRAPGPAIRDLTLSQLENYDVGRIRPGTDYSRQWRGQRRMDGVRIPTLANVFDLARHARNDAVRFNIEVKISPDAPDETLPPDAFTRKVIEAIRANGMEKRATIQSFDWRVVAIAQNEAPEIARACLTVQRERMDNIGAGHPSGSAWTAGIRYADHGSVPKMVKAAGCTIWSPYHGNLTEGLLKEAKGLGLRVVVWTVNDRQEMERLIDWGVDGIITDYPDQLRDAMAAKGLPLPAPSPVNL